MARHLGECRSQCRIALRLRLEEDLVARALHELGGTPLIQHLEMGDEACLEREAAQERLAEGMDRRDPEPLRGVHHLGE